jgi:hypothetical protein
MLDVHHELNFLSIIAARSRKNCCREFKRQLQNAVREEAVFLKNPSHLTLQFHRHFTQVQFRLNSFSILFHLTGPTAKFFPNLSIKQ